MDMRHVLLVLPFLLHGLLTEEVAEHNAKNPSNLVSDPSQDMVDIVIRFILWYHLYRRRHPAKDEDDLQRLKSLGVMYACINYINPYYIHLYTFMCIYTHNVH